MVSGLLFAICQDSNALTENIEDLQFNMRFLWQTILDGGCWIETDLEQMGGIYGPVVNEKESGACSESPTALRRAEVTVTVYNLYGSRGAEGT